MGTFLNLSFLSIFENILQKRLKCCPQLIFGEYGDPPLLSKWIPQLVIWLIIVVIGKSIILFFMLNLIARIDTAIKYAFQIFSHQPEVELVMVMIVIPTILNTIQFWVTDNFLKGQNDAEQLDEDSTQSLDEELISKVRRLQGYIHIIYIRSFTLQQNTFGDVEVSNTTPAKSKKRYTSRSSHNHIYMEMSSTMNAKHKDSSSSTSRSNSSDHSNSNSNSSEKSKYFKLSSSPPSSGPSAVASAAKLLTQTSSTIYKSYAPPTSAIHRAYERSGVPYLVNTVVELFVPATSGEAATAQKRNHQSNSRKSSNSNVSGDYSGLGGQERDGDEKDDNKDVDPLGQFDFDDPYITDHLLFKSSDAAPSRGRRVTSTSSSNDEIDLNTSKSSFL